MVTFWGTGVSAPTQRFWKLPIVPLLTWVPGCWAWVGMVGDGMQPQKNPCGAWPWARTTTEGADEAESHGGTLCQRVMPSGSPEGGPSPCLESFLPHRCRTPIY